MYFIEFIKTSCGKEIKCYALAVKKCALACLRFLEDVLFQESEFKCSRVTVY